MKELLIFLAALVLVAGLITCTSVAHGCAYVGHDYAYAPTGAVVHVLSMIDRSNPPTVLVRFPDQTTMTVLLSDLKPTPERR